MKKAWTILAVFAVLVNCVHAQQGGSLPRLAVVEFSTNDSADRVKKDAVTVRNLTESRMVASGKYEVISREEIDKLIANQRIQVSSISSTENLQKLQLQNINYIVTGSVDALGSDYAVTIKILNVSTGRFSHSDSGFIGGNPRDLFNGVNTLVITFMSGMAADGGQVTQAGGSSAAARPFDDGPVPAGLGYRVVDGKSVTITKYTGSAASIVIPARINGLPVTAIGDKAFYDCTGLMSISIPASVTAIGDWAFAYCRSLTNISIPASVTTIGDWAFSGCSGLTSISIPASVTTIGDSAFWGCRGLRSISIPASVTAIGDSAFAYCRSLTSISIPASVTSIGDWAFSGCSGLTSISIPASVTAIGGAAFYDCSGWGATLSPAGRGSAIGTRALAESGRLWRECQRRWCQTLLVSGASARRWGSDVSAKHAGTRHVGVRRECQRRWGQTLVPGVSASDVGVRHRWCQA